MSDVLVNVEHVSKKFCRDMKYSMVYGVKEIAQAMIGRIPDTDRLRPKEFWALNDISFDLKRGECLGLVGPNGSGKSTLLKMLNGIIAPDKGQIMIKGKVGAFIEVGAGFHPMLSGRENIYINGSVLGFTKKEIDRKFDAIVNFSGLEDFIDTPVKQYSSGMYVRLGFAIAAQMKPDVLLIDEVLAVGDVGFRAKCFNAISKMMRTAAVIFVSHNMPEVSRISSKICVLNKGEKIFHGEDVVGGIDKYYSAFPIEKSVIPGKGKVELHGTEMRSGNRKNVKQIGYLDEIQVTFDVTIDKEVKKPVIYINISNQSLQTVAQCSSSYNGVQLKGDGKRSNITVDLGKMNLNPGVYHLSVGFMEDRGGEVLFRHLYFKSFKVTGDFIGYAPMQINGKWEVNGVPLFINDERDRG